MCNKNSHDLNPLQIKKKLVKIYYLLSVIYDRIKHAKRIDIQTLREIRQNSTLYFKIPFYISTRKLSHNVSFHTIIQNIPILTSNPKMNQIYIHTNLSKAKTNDNQTRILEGWDFNFKQGQTFKTKTYFHRYI